MLDFFDYFDSVDECNTGIFDGNDKMYEFGNLCGFGVNNKFDSFRIYIKVEIGDKYYCVPILGFTTEYFDKKSIFIQVFDLSSSPNTMKNNGKVVFDNKAIDRKKKAISIESKYNVHRCFLKFEKSEGSIIRYSGRFIAKFSYKGEWMHYRIDVAKRTENEIQWICKLTPLDMYKSISNKKFSLKDDLQKEIDKQYKEIENGYQSGT